jgi:hypothetical protein
MNWVIKNLYLQPAHTKDGKNSLKALDIARLETILLYLLFLYIKYLLLYLLYLYI